MSPSCAAHAESGPRRLRAGGKIVQNNIRVQITRALGNEINQATDDASSRQTAPADQSRQSSPDTPSAASKQRIRGHDPRMDQTVSRE